MEDETILVIVILVGFAAMIVGLFIYMRRLEARLAAQDRIEISIYSDWRTAVVILLAMVVVAVLAAVAVAVTATPLHEHALAATMVPLAGTCASLLVAMLATRKFRRIGVLALGADSLDLTGEGERQTLDLRRPFALFEARSWTDTMSLQFVLITQDDRSWGFSYGLAVRRQAYGHRAVDEPPLGPMLGGEARVLHDRLRAQPTMTPDPGSGPWRTDVGLLALRDGRWSVSR